MEKSCFKFKVNISNPIQFYIDNKVKDILSIKNKICILKKSRLNIQEDYINAIRGETYRNTRFINSDYSEIAVETDIRPLTLYANNKISKLDREIIVLQVKKCELKKELKKLQDEHKYFEKYLEQSGHVFGDSILSLELE